MSLTHIETIELDSSQSSITFSSIPQDYDDLVLVSNVREDSLGETALVGAINGSSANFSYMRLVGDGTSVSSGSGNAGWFGIISGSRSTSNTFANNQAYIFNYTSSSAKSISGDYTLENNATTSYPSLYATLWNDTSPITSIELSSTSSANLIAGSTFSLYGVTAGGDGTVTTA